MDEEEMKQILLNHCKECHLREYTSCVECEEKFTKATNKVLNLIDKLQKENRELQEKRDEEVNYFCNRMNNVGENVEKVYEIKDKKIDKLQKENEKLKEKLHEKNMQIIKLNELLGELL